VFWKVVEILVRIVYFRRFRAARRIGEAGALLADGRPEDALALLERVGERLHQSLLSFWSFTRGRVLDRLGRPEEAEAAFSLVVLAEPDKGRADLELAVLCGRRRRFDECRQWLDRLDGKDDAEAKARAAPIRGLLERVLSGERERELEGRARNLAARPLPPSNAPPGLPPDLAVLDGFIDAAPEEARESLDDIALLVAFGEVAAGARFELSLSLEDSAVVRPDGSRLDPFAAVSARIDDRAPGLSQAIEAGWRSRSGAG
jgi:tetratricopeptide (TPR) repeat protein